MRERSMLTRACRSSRENDVSPSFDFDRTLADWLDAQAPPREPDGLTYAVMARTRRTRH